MNRRNPIASSPARPVPTIREVAHRARVSTATVSRVLAGLGGAGAQTQSRVLNAVRDLDYHPNRLARGLRARDRKVVGLLIPDLQNPFFTGIARGLEEVLCGAGLTLVLGHSDGLAERERAHLAVLRGEGADGLVLIPGNGPGASYATLRAWEIPVVCVDRSPVDLEADLVTATHREGARGATRHLLELGHASVALINGPRSFDVARERYAGYAAALREAGRTVRPEWVVHSDFRQAAARAAMGRLLDLPAPPRAVLVANNLMTLGALQTIHERRLRIPEDVAIIGFDDMPWAMSLWPPLTAVAQPAEELGRSAAELLLERMKDPRRPRRNVVLPTQLIVRASCGAGCSCGSSFALASSLNPAETLNPETRTRP